VTTLSGQYVNPISLNRSLLQYNQAYFLSQDNLLLPQQESSAGLAEGIRQEDGSLVEASFTAERNLWPYNSLLPSKDSLLLDDTLSSVTRRLPAVPGVKGAGPRGLHAGTLAVRGHGGRTEAAGTAGIRSKWPLRLARAQSVEGDLWACPETHPAVPCPE
jgi:hypothetical protein